MRIPGGLVPYGVSISVEQLDIIYFSHLSLSQSAEGNHEICLLLGVLSASEELFFSAS